VVTLTSHWNDTVKNSIRVFVTRMLYSYIKEFLYRKIQMLPGVGLTLRRNPSNITFGKVDSYNSCYVKIERSSCCTNSVVMGPVIASLVLYGIERICTRVFAGQLLRKGIGRKVRRLTVMMTRVEVLSDVIPDFIDDVLDWFMGSM
jgi:hypothetical protein